MVAALSQWNDGRPYVRYAQQIVRLRLTLSFMRRADLVILSQGGNSDGVYFCNVIRRAETALRRDRAEDIRSLLAE